MNKGKNINDLLTSITCLEIAKEIIGLTTDSRSVLPGFLFFAYPGEQQDGRDYIADAIERGAIAVLYEDQDAARFSFPDRIPVIPISGLCAKAGKIAANFYDNPSSNMTVIGFTGTNGKTTCSQVLADTLIKNQIPCGVIGTLGAGFPNQLELGINTTPNPVVLQKQLFDLHVKGAEVIAMEVSSHALDQGRISGVDFDIAVFTNLTRDHLDYHGCIESYKNAKRLLFTEAGIKKAVINADDDFGKQLLRELNGKVPVIGYSTGTKNFGVPIVRAVNIKLSDKGFTADIETPIGTGTLKSHLLGRFNISNLLAVLAVLQLMDIPLDTALTSLAKPCVVPGRMQMFGGGKKPLVVVDFAHTPDALENVLMIMRDHCKGKLCCVFGCGGDRDRGKRALMGQIAERYSDQIIITDDNPRHEDSQLIADDICKGFLCPWAVEIEHDRGSAIAHAVDCAESGDVVLIAGKGHETYQIVGDKKLHFSDIECTKQNLSQYAK